MRYALTIYNATTPQQIIELFKEIPENISSLYLTIDFRFISNYENVFNYLPPNITALHFDSEMSLQSLDYILEKIPTQITELGLSVSTFSHPRYLKSIPKKITIVELPSKSIYYLNPTLVFPNVKAVVCPYAKIGIEEFVNLNNIFPNARLVENIQQARILIKAEVLNETFRDSDRFFTLLASELKLKVASYALGHAHETQNEIEFTEEVKKGLLNAQEVKAENNFLIKLNFNNYLHLFEAKCIHFMRPLNLKALAVTDQLLKDLYMAKLEFITSKKPLQTRKENLITRCSLAIKSAEGVLAEHRGWKEALANFASVLVSISTFGLANYLTGLGFFKLFPVQTDSTQKIEQFKMDLTKVGL